MTRPIRPILTTNDDLATIQVDVAAARALGLTEDGVARLMLDAQAAAEVLARATDTRWTVERVEPAEVTGETITDAQITALRLQIAREMDTALMRARLPQAEAIGAAPSPAWEDLHADFKVLDAALGRVRNSRRTKGYKRAARARAAAIYHARFGGLP